MQTLLYYPIPYRIELTHLLSHTRTGQLTDPLGNLPILRDLLYLLHRHLLHVVAVLDQEGQLREDVVVGDELGEFGEVPGEPFADAHAQGVHVLVEELE